MGSTVPYQVINAKCSRQMTGTEDYISADQGCVEKMEYTAPELAISGFIVEFGDCLSDHLSYIGSYTELQA